MVHCLLHWLSWKCPEAWAWPHTTWAALGPIFLPLLHLLNLISMRVSFNVSFAHSISNTSMFSSWCRSFNAECLGSLNIIPLLNQDYFATGPRKNLLNDMRPFTNRILGSLQKDSLILMNVCVVVPVYHFPVSRLSAGNGFPVMVTLHYGSDAELGRTGRRVHPWLQRDIFSVTSGAGVSWSHSPATVSTISLPNDDLKSE